MQPTDFEQFMSDLQSALQLRPQQRAEIREELLDHFHAFVEERVTAGVPREEATRQAIEEFGDAVDLAQAFGQIGQPRRWIMRSMMAASVVAAVSLATNFMMPVNSGGVGPGAANASGNGDGNSDVAVKSMTKAMLTEPTHMVYQDKLDTAINDVHFEEAPFQDVVSYLSEESGINILVNWNSLESVAVFRDTKVTLSLRKVPLRSVLEFVMDQVSELDADVDYELRSDVVYISTSEIIRRHTVAIVYDISDLIATPLSVRERGELETALGRLAVTDRMRGMGGEAGVETLEALQKDDERVRIMKLIDDILSASRVGTITQVIQATVDPEGWRENGGNVGSISSVGGSLVIVQTSANHSEIRKLLTDLRTTRSRQAGQAD